MDFESVRTALLIAAAILGIAGLYALVAGIAALSRARLVRFGSGILAGLVLLLSGAVLGLVAFGTQGYRALTREDVVASVSVRTEGPQRFRATFRFSDGLQRQFVLSGDELYVDAHILKWAPLANILGLHTAYELDRVAGRYRDIAQERAAERTVHALGREKAVDLFDLRRRHAFLAPLLDAEYGSATFIPADRPAELELRISTTGLLFRERKSASE